ncbi:MAG: class I SAM-dependent methyltransferase [Anaerolineae bacterium]|jgi:ubiquinone/menaquinone biosynthesis C-methylase UbiE
MPLTAVQSAQLDALLRNESDVAYKRRVRTMLAYLDLSPGLDVLDCGTGMGFYSLCMTELYDGLRIWGIDRDTHALAFARQALAGRPVLLCEGDILRLPYADASFDRVLLTEVLEHLTDDAVGLRELYRVLKPGGVLTVTVPAARYSGWYDPINRAAEAVTGRPIRTGPFAGIWANHRRLYTASQLQTALCQAGFECAAVEPLTHYCFPATQTLVYTVGKGLIERGLLPEFISRSTHRFRGRDNANRPWNPINWALAVINWFDRWNDDPARMARKETFVSLAVRAVKPTAHLNTAS